MTLQSDKYGSQTRKLIQLSMIALLAAATPTLAQDANPATDTRPPIAPDIREDDVRLKVQRGDFVAVPIPISDPTLEEGLILGAAYFYGQSEEQAETQPASVTGAAALYTNNNSRAFAVFQQNYWRENRWRFTGAVGAADLRLSLLTVDDGSDQQSIDWRINGGFLFGKLARRIGGSWYGGGLVRVVDANQSLDFGDAPRPQEFDSGSNVRSVGIGFYTERDSRDNPYNSTAGSYFKGEAIFNDESIGSKNTYQGYSAVFRSYHSLTDNVVLAWEAQGCQRGGTTPLWDACFVKLRGFPATDYLGQTSASGQLEARWQMSKRWGVVGFAGAGYVGSSFSDIREYEPIPSYGAGLRFMVLASKRINMRLDYARSTDSDAIHFSVGEAF